jgi:hypothetical protein
LTAEEIIFCQNNMVYVANKELTGKKWQRLLYRNSCNYIHYLFQNQITIVGEEWT